MISTITKLEMKEISKSPGNLKIFDVRDRNEVDAGMIPNAKHFCLKEITEAMALSEEDFGYKYGFSKPKPSDSLVLYCRSGRRSGLAVAEFQKLGFKNIKDYGGGWLDWSQN
jgi:rhodanese-related sulfurtransferase